MSYRSVRQLINYMRVNWPMGAIFLCVHLAGFKLSAALTWPTPNPAFQDGQSIEAFIQSTSSGRVESGLFGCVRNDGYRFHEALDLYPVKRDRRGEALDPIYSVLPGRVVYVNKVASNSGYGRYVVVEHDQEKPAFHTLYAHLASIGQGIIEGARVESGSVLGVMGRSASYSIPRSRAHLHFEIGFRLTDDFQDWFDRQKFESRNWHGKWNGMNLVSIDPLAFYQAIRSGRVKNLNEHIKAIPAVARIRVHTSIIPDFVKNYPTLVTRQYYGQQVVAWDIAFTQYGLPKEWTPVFASESKQGNAGDVRVISYDLNQMETQKCKQVLSPAGSHPTLSKETLNTLRKLFGFK